LVSACKKNDPVPTTGSPALTFTYDSIYAGYSLFTEEGWRLRVTTGTGNPLRSGMFAGPPPITNTRVKTYVAFNDLNAGNYVFVVTTSTAQSVQVTAGQTNAYTFSL
jgi:hypothetical protein